jgi:hypothetical protein
VKRGLSGSGSLRTQERTSVAVDIQRVVLAAVEAGLSDYKPEKKSRLSAGKAVTVGAVLVTAGRIAAKPGGRFVMEKLRERLSDGSEDDEYYKDDDRYDEAEAEFGGGEEPEPEEDQEPEAEADQEPDAEGDQGPEGEAEESEEPEGEEAKRAAAEASEEDEPDADDHPDAGPGSDDEGPDPDDEGPDEPEVAGDEDDVGDVSDESDGRPSKTRPRPPIFDRAGASGSKIRPAARPPLAKKKRPSGLKNRSRPGRPGTAQQASA